MFPELALNVTAPLPDLIWPLIVKSDAVNVIVPDASASTAIKLSSPSFKVKAPPVTRTILPIEEVTRSL